MIKSVKRIDYGICQAINESFTQDRSSPTGYLLNADNLRFIERSDKLKIRKGLVFGISYQVETSLADYSEVFLCRIRHPQLVNSATGKAYKETVEEKHTSRDNINFDYYRFEYDFELVAGKWSFQIEQSGKILLRQNFELYY